MAKKAQGNVVNALLDPNKIRYDGTQSRAEIDQVTVADYAETYQDDPKALPELTVFYDGVDHWLADGFHRLLAAIDRKLKKVSCIVHRGDQRAAILYSVGANHKHGLRRKSCDKRKAVAMLLADAEWSKWSDRAVAEHCHVGHPLVAEVRKSIPVQLEDIPVEISAESGITEESTESPIAEISPPLKIETPVIHSEPAAKPTDKRTGLDGKQRPATNQPKAEKPPKNGSPTWSPQRFKDIYDYLGKVLPKMDVLNRDCPCSKFNAKAQQAVKDAMQFIEDWKGASKP